MTHIDAVRQPGTVLLDGATLDRLDAISVATGRTPAEVLALLVAEAPIVEVPAAAPARVLTAANGRFGCTEGPKEHPADWALFAPGNDKWVVGDGDLIGRACCDDHIPDGWVRPDTNPVADALALVGLPAHKQPANLIAASDQHQARKAAGHIPPHVHLNGGPCVYGEACDQ